MKFISLFAGVGGFDEGMERAGHVPVAQVEWDKDAAGVLKRRWPDVPLFCDVSKVTADDLPDADFITYGFPCQDLSVAGKRKGLEGERSGLFFEATRLIRELIARGSGLRFAVAENVAGLFSADDGEAFARCIRELLDCGSRQVGWRLLDSQYFGVAQRRKRVFIVSDFGGESCDEVLAVSESLRGHPAPSREAGQSSPADAGGGFTPGSFGGYEEGGDLGGGSETLAVACDVYNGEETGETAATVTSATGISNASGPKVMASIQNCTRGKDQNGLGVTEGDSPVYTLGGADHHAVAYEQEGIAFEPKSLDGPPRVTGDIKKVVSPALNCMGGGQREPAIVSWNGDTTPKASEDVSVTLRSQQGGEGVGVAFHATQDPIHSEEHTPTLGANATIGYQQNLTVRRLTCRECERLQGFPDDWTLEKMEVELEGNEWKATGKVVKQADGPRYRACGNAVTVNVAEWIGRRLRRLQATYTLEELDELGVGTTYPKTLGEYLREDCG